MKVWTLMENTACREGLKAEHGLSLYLETGDLRILFDAGQTGAFADNAEKMGIDLSRVTLAVLSHGHYDHGGGLKRFLEINSQVRIYVNQHAFEPHYHGPGKYIGLDPSLQDLGRFVTAEAAPAPGLALLTLDPPPFPMDSGGLHVMEDGILKDEDFRHEQYLLVEEAGKRILFSGCSHRGIGNIVSRFRPDVLVGGFHLMGVTGESRLRETAELLRAFPTDYYTGHCTGPSQFAFLKRVLGDRLTAISTGMVFEI